MTRLAITLAVLLTACASPTLPRSDDCDEVALDLNRPEQTFLTCHETGQRIEVVAIAGKPIAICRCPSTADGGTP